MGEVMKSLLEKISSYEIFNNFLPGIVSCYLINNFTRFSIPKDTIWVDLFIYYFVGLVMSRIGSLVVETTLCSCKFIEFAPYSEYQEAIKKEPFIQKLNETNNLYRTMVAVFLVMMLIKLYETVQRIDELPVLLLCLLAVVLFVYSYKKQTGYVRQRVENA